MRSLLLPRSLADLHVKREPIAQSLDVATQAFQREGVIAALLDAGDLGLGDPDPLGQLRLGQPRGLAGLDQLEPELALGRLLLLDGLVLGVSLELRLPPTIADGPVCDRVSILFSRRLTHLLYVG